MNTSLVVSETPEPHDSVNIEGHEVRAFFEGAAPIWFVVPDLGPVSRLSQSRLANLVADLDDEDKGIRLTNTLGGPQKLTVVSRSGVYQIIAQLRDRELGKRLRKRMADLTVAFETRKLRAMSDADFYRAAVYMESIENRVAELESFKETMLELQLRQTKALPAKALAPDQIDRFLAECTEPVPGNLISNSELLTAHNKWAARDGYALATPTGMGIRLSRAGVQRVHGRGGKAEVLAMREAGASIKQIADKFGTSMGATWQFLMLQARKEGEPA